MFYVQAFKMIPHRRKKEPTKYGLATLRIEKHNNNLFTRRKKINLNNNKKILL
jgi:hypothetical protein